MLNGITGIYFFSKLENKLVKYLCVTEKFDYMTIKYATDIYVKAVGVFGNDADGFFHRPFYLEPGERTLSFFVSREEKTVADFVGVNYINLENKKGRLEIKSIEFSVRKRFKSAVLENDEIIAGFSADKGGVLSFLTSKKYSVKEFLLNDEPVISFEKEKPLNVKENSNLINVYDNGRYPQQVFYGTDKPPYSASVYRETLWRMNPVQSGDSYGFLSEIVDYRVDKEKVYFRLIPLDWAKKNVPCDAYMECEYSLFGNAVKVKNKFVDFSMLNVGLCVAPLYQEFPSFNVIQTLNKFFLPSQKAFKKDIPLTFWGEEESVSKQKFYVETFWSAWLNANNFGLGLYTPETLEHFVGKYKSEEKDDVLPSCNSKSVNYMAGIRKASLESLVPVKYEYYIAVGSVKEIQSVFAKVSKKKRKGNDDERF